MGKYKKFITAIIGAVITGLAVFWGVESTWDANQITIAIMPVVTALGVYFFPNSESG